MDSPARAPSSAGIARLSGLNLAARLTSGAAVLGLAILSTNVLDTHGREKRAIRVSPRLVESAALDVAGVFALLQTRREGLTTDEAAACAGSRSPS